MDDTTFCPVCFEEFKETGDHVPRLLPCTHTLCHRCVCELLRENILTCPQDRQEHPAKSGTISFPQNKYILKNLKEKPVTIEAGFERCEIHGRELSLYCKGKGCKKTICQLCHIGTHRSHNVVDILQELERQRDFLVTDIEHVTNDLMSRKNKLLAAKKNLGKMYTQSSEVLKRTKEEVAKIIDNVIKELEQNMENVSSTLDEKTVLIEEMLTMLNAIKQNVTTYTTINAVQVSLDTVERTKIKVLDTCKNVGFLKYFDYDSRLDERFKIVLSKKYLPILLDFNLDVKTFGKHNILLDINLTVARLCGKVMIPVTFVCFFVFVSLCGDCLVSS